MRRLVSVLAFLVFAGCSLAPLVCAGGCVPTERRSMIEQEQRESIATSTTTDVVRSTQTQPTPVTVTTRDGTRIEVPAAVTETVTASTTATEKAAAAASGKAAESQTIPLFVKLIGGAVALGLLWLVVWLWRRTSKLVDAAYAAGDELAARCIHAVRSLAMQATNPEERARLSALAGDMERDRTNWHRED